MCIDYVSKKNLPLKNICVYVPLTKCFHALTRHSISKVKLNVIHPFCICMFGRQLNETEYL